MDAPSTLSHALPGPCPTCGDDLILLFQFYACKHVDCATRPKLHRCPQCGTAEVEPFLEPVAFGWYGTTAPQGRWHCLPRGHLWTP